jgi:hypothetical protein
MQNRMALSTVMAELKLDFGHSQRPVIEKR